MIASCPSIVAFIAEPHIFDSVVQLVDNGRPAFSEAWRAALPLPGHQAIAENQLVDIGRRDAGALYRRLDRHRTEIARGERSEVALKTADRRSRRTDDDYRIVLHNVFAPRQNAARRGRSLTPAVPPFRAASAPAAAGARVRRRSSDTRRSARWRTLHRTCIRSCRCMQHRRRA
jgi:hypothetical protein